MYWIILTIVWILCGLFGWWIADVAIIAGAVKETLGKPLPKLPVWKAWALEALFVLIIFGECLLWSMNEEKRVYDTNQYQIEYQMTDEGQIDSTTFKIVKR